MYMLLSISGNSCTDLQMKVELFWREKDCPCCSGMASQQSNTDKMPETQQVTPETTNTVVVVENRLAYIGIIIPMSILGTLIRIGLLRLETYEGAPVFGLVYAQWIGCFIMGIAVQKKGWFQYVYPPLQVGLSTGLCGSITTFSSWQRDIFEGFANYTQANHYRGYNILAAISQLLVTLAMSLNGLIFGRHVGRILLPFEPPSFKLVRRPLAPWQEKESFRKTDWMVIAFGILSWIGVIIAAALTTQQRALAFACVFSPVGAVLRWYLSFINTRYVNFMYGTFAANMIGTLTLAILSLAGNGVYISWIGCQVLLGLADGFCGKLYDPKWRMDADVYT